jgi:hypothetical protein
VGFVGNQEKSTDYAQVLKMPLIFVDAPKKVSEKHGATTENTNDTLICSQKKWF